jgi:hypothetical protein
VIVSEQVDLFCRVSNKRQRSRARGTSLSAQEGVAAAAAAATTSWALDLNSLAASSTCSGPDVEEDDMDSEELEGCLTAMYQEVQEETIQMPTSFTELLLGNWDGFDMASALFTAEPGDQAVALATSVQNVTATVRSPTDVDVTAIISEMRNAL